MLRRDAASSITMDSAAPALQLAIAWLSLKARSSQPVLCLDFLRGALNLGSNFA